MSDNSWTKFGKDNPYFAVITHDHYHKENLNDKVLDEFFISGELHVDHLFKIFKNNLNLADTSFKRILDFGCGTGRLVVPFASRAEKVVALDISQPMLDETKKNLEKRGINNVELIQCEDISTHEFADSFDLVHTVIVLQHMPVSAGYKTINKLLSFTSEGGYGMIHLTFSNNRSSLSRSLASLKNSFALTRGFWNVVRGKSFNDPVMQMNNYSLEKVFRMMFSHNLKKIFLEFTDHGHLGVCIYYQK